MNRLVYVLIFVSVSGIYAQVGDGDKDDLYDKFNELITYTPNGLMDDQEFKELNFGFDVQTISNVWGLQNIYRLKERTGFSNRQVVFLEKKIGELALAFYLENRRILLEYYGGASGCVKNPIDSAEDNGHEITILRFCHNCTDRDPNVSKFIEIFNHRSNQLISLN